VRGEDTNILTRLSSNHNILCRSTCSRVAFLFQNKLQTRD